MRVLPPVLFALCVAAQVPAQPDFAFNKGTPGTLGRTLDLRYTGATVGRSLIFMISLNGGPTPLSLIQPNDPRVLLVGLDLAPAWAVLPVTQGFGTISLPVPVTSSLAGLLLHFQTLTAPGSPFIVDQISDKVVVQLGAPLIPEPLAPGMFRARAFPSVVFDRDNNSGAGDAVIAGGGTGSLSRSRGLMSSEVFDFQTLGLRLGALMDVARSLNTAVTLDDGRVLLAGGVDENGDALASATLYNPRTDAFRATGPMFRPRVGHAAAKLPSGRVLVAGGTTSASDFLVGLSNVQRSAEIYDPASGTWSPARDMPRHLVLAALTTLSTGQVLLSGGAEVDFPFGIPIPQGTTPECSLYDPPSDTWSSAARMHASRAGHTFNTVVLDDGRVLVTGGVQSGVDLVLASAIASVEAYTPGADTWTALPDMATNRALHTATRMLSGRVVVAGGANGSFTSLNALAGVEVFDPVLSFWRGLAELSGARAGHGAALLPDGLLVLFGGQTAGGSTTLSTVETVRL